MVLGVFLWGMFAAARIVRKEEELLKPHTTPAEHTVMLSNLPAPAKTEHLVETMASYGD